MRTVLMLFAILLTACGGSDSSNDGEPIAFERLHCPAVGNNSIFSEPLQEVIRSQHRFTEVYLGVDDQLPEQVSDIDFSEKQVIAIIDGMRPTGGYSVDIQGIERHDDNVRVRYLTERPGEDCLATTVVTYPYCLVVTDRTNLPVEFEEHESINHCE